MAAISSSAITLAIARMDCTADKLYTLSEGTKETLKGLTDTVSIRFYYSKDVAKMPVYFKNYAMRVEDLLQEYKQVAGKKLEIKKLNPKPDTDAEDSANLDGISGKSLDVFGDEQIYLGLAVSCGNRTEAIPFLSPDREKLLEYDLTRAIVGVKSAKKPKVGVISALKIMGYEEKGYYRRIETIRGYFNFNMDLLKPGVRKELFGTNPVYTKTRDSVPTIYRANAKIKNSLIADGCVIDGEVENCVLFRGVTVAKGAKLKNCVIMQDGYIEEDVELENVIFDKAVTIRSHSRLVGPGQYPIVIGKNITL